MKRQHNNDNNNSRYEIDITQPKIRTLSSDSHNCKYNNCKENNDQKPDGNLLSPEDNMNAQQRQQQQQQQLPKQQQPNMSFLPGPLLVGMPPHCNNLNINTGEHNNDNKYMPDPQIPQMLMAIKTDYEFMAREYAMVKTQRDEYEKDLRLQVIEVTKMNRFFTDLERMHAQITAKQEQDIAKLQEILRGLSTHPHFAEALQSLNIPASETVAKRLKMAPDLHNLTNGNNNNDYNDNDNGNNSKSNNRNITAQFKLNIADLNDNEDMDGGNDDDGCDGDGDGDGNDEDAIGSNNRNSKGGKNTAAANNNHQSSPNNDNRAIANTKNSSNSYSNGSKSVISVDPPVVLNHDGFVCCVCFDLEGKMLISGSNRVVRMYSLGDNPRLISSYDATGPTAAGAGATDGADEMKVTAAPAAAASKLPDLYLRSVCVTSDHKFICAGAEDTTIKVWDVNSKEIVSVFGESTIGGSGADAARGGGGKNGWFYTVDSFEHLVACGSDSGRDACKIWSLDTNKLVCSFEEETDSHGVASLSFRRDGAMVAAGYLDCCIRVWDVPTSRLLAKFARHSETIYSVKFSSNGRLLVSGSQDKTVRIFDIRASVTASAFSMGSGDGSGSGSGDHSSLPGAWATHGGVHRDFVLCVCFSADDNYVVSGCKDKTVRFWDVRTRKCVKTLSDHKNSVLGVASVLSTADNCAYLASGSGDSKVRLWRYRAVI